MADVFISYSTHDINRANAVRDLLKAKGISCWMGDKDIHASSTYTEVITKAIKNCNVFLLMLSSHAQESTYVLSEFECAISLKKKIVPIIIENFKINEEFLFHIRHRQAIKAYEDWKEAQKELLDTVKYLLQNLQSKERKKEPFITQSVSDVNNTVTNDATAKAPNTVPNNVEETKLNTVTYNSQQRGSNREIIDVRYGTHRIPVKVAEDGKYQILCRNCDNISINNYNYEVVDSKAEKIEGFWISFACISIVACFISLIFFLTEELEKINRFVLLTVANPFFWGIGIIISAWIYPNLYKKCIAIYRTTYQPEIKYGKCRQTLFCRKCDKTFEIEIPVNDCGNFFFIDPESSTRHFIGKTKPEPRFTPIMKKT